MRGLQYFKALGVVCVPFPVDMKHPLMKDLVVLLCTWCEICPTWVIPGTSKRTNFSPTCLIVPTPTLSCRPSPS